MKLLDVVCYTDGGCAPTNPGIGGYGVRLLCPSTDYTKDISGGFEMTTNNRMEIYAAIVALESLKRDSVNSVTIYSDSTYVVNTFSKGWIENWKRTNWKRGTILNVDLWKRLDSLVSLFNATFVWVKGHSGNVHNDAVDALCAVGRSGELSIDVGYVDPTNLT